jgi:hypothetical protein
MSTTTHRSCRAIFKASVTAGRTASTTECLRHRWTHRPFIAPPHQWAPSAVSLPDRLPMHHWCGWWRPSSPLATSGSSMSVPLCGLWARWPRARASRRTGRSGLPKPQSARGWTTLVGRYGLSAWLAQRAVGPQGPWPRAGFGPGAGNFLFQFFFLLNIPRN